MKNKKSKGKVEEPHFKFRFIVSQIKSIIKWFFSINGLLFTLLISLFASSLSFYLQDKIQRQRYLELLELELKENLISGITEVQPYQKSGVLSPPYYSYRSEVFNSGLQSGYILSVDSKTLAQLYLLNTSLIPGVNKLIEQAETSVDEYKRVWFQCINTQNQEASKGQCDSQRIAYETAVKNYSDSIGNYYIGVDNYLTTIKFNPTKDRLNSPFLKLLMGSDSVKVLQ